MIVTSESVVYTNPYPAARSEQLSGTSLAQVTSAGSGALHCSFRCGSARMSPDGRVLVASSVDDGRSWSLHEPPWGDVGDQVQLSGGQIGASGTGTVVLAVARMTMASPGSDGWNAEAAGILDADSVVLRRAAGGDWSPPMVLDMRRHADEWAIPCGPPLWLGGSRWFLPMERHGKARVPEWLRAYHAFGVVSTDDGATWREVAPMMNDPDRRVAHYDQHIALTSGGLLSLAWAHDVIDDVTLTARAGWSQDEGRTWSPPRPTTINGGPVAAVTLPGGRLFAVYPRRRDPTGIRACLSTDGGRTWDTDDEFVIWDETVRRVVGEPAVDRRQAQREPPLWNTMWSWTFGLPCPVAHADGSVGVAFYATEPSGASTVRYVRVTV